jgi:hypothetical protein
MQRTAKRAQPRKPPVNRNLRFLGPPRQDATRQKGNGLDHPPEEHKAASAGRYKGPTRCGNASLPGERWRICAVS